MEKANDSGKEAFDIRAEERERFARELHDTVGQYFVSLELLLSRLRMEIGQSEPAAAMIREMADILKEAHGEIRTLSFLLSPPWIEEDGLETAIRRFVRGFARRAGLTGDIHVHGPPFRLDRPRQVTLFRIVQEALVNVYRHANADCVAVKLVNDGTNVTIEVADNGTGFSEPGSVPEHGAGLMGMRARIEQYRGELHIATGSTGTTLTATLPAE